MSLKVGAKDYLTLSSVGLHSPSCYQQFTDSNMAIAQVLVRKRDYPCITKSRWKVDSEASRTHFAFREPVSSLDKAVSHTSHQHKRSLSLSVVPCSQDLLDASLKHTHCESCCVRQIPHKITLRGIVWCITAFVSLAHVHEGLKWVYHGNDRNLSWLHIVGKSLGNYLKQSQFE